MAQLWQGARLGRGTAEVLDGKGVEQEQERVLSQQRSEMRLPLAQLAEQLSMALNRFKPRLQTPTASAAVQMHCRLLTLS